MYESCFGLNARPFAAAVSAKRYFPGDSSEAARENLARCVDRAEGVGLLVGPAGTGKSLLCQVLAEQFRRVLQVALLASGQLCTRRALLQAILFELGLPFRGMEEGDLRLSLVDHLSPHGKSGETASALKTAPLLLVIDEAHTLPMRLLEELRLITNLVRDGQPRVRLVLAGSPQLEDRFAHPKMESFNQRVATRCYLEALDRQQTIGYVRHQILQAGGQTDRIFTPDAFEAIAQASDGIPRLINQICDHVLLLAFAGGMQQITAQGVQEAWADLQQLPSPWNAAPGIPAPVDARNVVEFGSLDDEVADDLPSAVPFPIAGEFDDSTESPPADPLDSFRDLVAPPHEYHDDFHPAGSIGPEVELVFPHTSNPFRGEFDEEEVVLDRYTSLEVDALANRPLVRSAQSRQLAALLKAADVSVEKNTPDKPAMAIDPATWPGGMLTSTPGRSPSAQEQAAAQFTQQMAPSSTAPLSASALTAIEPTTVEANITSQPAWSEPVTSPPVLTQLQPPDVDDADLIVIEESLELKPPVHHPPVRVRRQEYRQLFAQLRRG